MKAKLIGITVGILLLITGVTTASPSNKPAAPLSPLDDNVPEWQVGNSWTYTMNNFTYNYNEEGQKILLNGKIDDFTLTVTDTSDSTYYTIEYTGKLTATYDIDLSSSSGNLRLKGTIKPTLTRLKGTILFTKSDLQIHDVTAEIKGLTMATIAPLSFPLPIPFKFITDGQFSADFPLFDFPLAPIKLWDMPNLDITMQSNAGGIFGILQVPISFGVHYSWTLWAFHCQDKQDITVPAGTYSAYKISSLVGNYFDYYYAPEVGNLIKLDISLQYGQASAELTSFNYP